MKKLSMALCLLAFVLNACGATGSNPQPTAVTLPTAAPTAEVVANPTLAPESGTAGSERTTTGDGMIQVFVPGATYQMGSLDKDAQNNERPPHAVSVSSFWIDKVEVTNAMYLLCVQAGSCTAPRLDKSATHATYYSNKDFADFPVVYVNWQDASNYCQWAGRRLPTEAEWELAARGAGDPRRFPWGDQSPTDSLANYDRQAKDTTRVGSYPKGASQFGALDMAGNVWEWVSDFYSPDYYNQSAGLQDPTGSKGTDGGSKVLRGGSWMDVFKELRVSNRGSAKSPDLTADSKSEAYQGESNDRIGFRCAAPGQ